MRSAKDECASREELEWQADLGNIHVNFSQATREQGFENFPAVLMDIVLTSAALMGAEGGAIASLNPLGARLEVTDIYSPRLRDGDPITKSFSLPIHAGSGWQEIVHHEQFWWSELNDARFTDGFKNYHDEAGRRFFAHFPILLFGKPKGFLGLAFSNSNTVNYAQSKAVQLMAGYAGLLIQLNRTPTIASVHGTGVSPAINFGSGFSIKMTRHIDGLIAGRQWSHLRAADLASYAGYSTRQFHQLFVQEFGETPHAWILARRLSAAREMLLEKQPISFVAYKLGFADQAHFAKRFRAAYGYPPSDALAYS